MVRQEVPPKEKWVGPKWDYRCISCGPNTVDKVTKKAMSMKDILYKVGPQGWELVQIVTAYQIGETEAKPLDTPAIQDALGMENKPPSLPGTQSHTHVVELIMVFKRPVIEPAKPIGG